jgi:hypothetical protein
MSTTRSSAEQLSENLTSLLKSETDSLFEDMRRLFEEHKKRVIREALLPEGSGWSPLRMTNSVRNQTNENKQLPIHDACERKAPLEVIRFLLGFDKRKTTLYQANKFGRLPLHLACLKNAPLDVV